MEVKSDFPMKFGSPGTNLMKFIEISSTPLKKVLLLQCLIKQFHCIDFGLLCNINIRFHGLVAGVAGPLHYNLGRNTAGEGEADESAAAGVGAYHLILGEYLLDSFAATVAGPGYGSVETGQLAEALQIPVHQLVGNHRQGFPVREVAMLVLFEDFLGKAVQVDGKAVIGLHRGDVHRIAFNVGPLEVGHIGIAERGECTEAEHIPRPGKASGILHGLFILFAVHILQLDHHTISGDLKVVEVHQFLLRQEDDRLVQNLELGPVSLDGVLCSTKGRLRPAFFVGRSFLAIFAGL